MECSIMNPMDLVAPKEQIRDHASMADESNSVNAFDILLILARNWRRIAVVTLIALVLGLVIAFILKPSYTAKALILPPQQQRSSASELLNSLGSLGALSAISGGGAEGLLKNPSDMYIGILKSQTISDQLISEFHLQQVYRTKTLYDTRTALEKHADFETGKDNLIHIEVKDHSAKRASDIANGYIHALYQMNSTLATTEAAQRRLFFDQQVNDEKRLLNKAEDALAATQVKTGLIQLSGQAEIIIRTIALTQAQIASDQVALKSLLTSSTEQNPSVQRLRQEIATLQTQLDKLQNDQKKLQPGDIEVPAGRVPHEALEFSRKLRDVKYHEALFGLLSKQAEAARIDEAKSAPVIQVIDHATPPDKKSGPYRSLIVVGIGFAGFIFACIWSLAASTWTRMRTIPEYNVRIQQFRATLRPHRR